MSSGATLDSISGKSFTNPGSYSIVVMAPVEPETKTVTVPFKIPDSEMASATCSVMSMISFSYFELILICFVITAMLFLSKSPN